MSNTLEYNSISELLNAEFHRRKHRNEAYSLRAFARDLDLNLTSLSNVLRGKQGLSERATDALAARLRLKEIERSFVKDLVLSETARNAKVRELARARIAEARKLQRLKHIADEQFRLIASWHHSAILELTQLEDFSPSPQWIADRLGIEPTEATAALVRLEKLGLIKWENETWVALPEGYDAIVDRPTAATRLYLKQLMSMSTDSLFEDPLEERENLAMILAIPRSRLPELRAEMRRFMADFWRKIENEPKDTLYSLSLQLSPIKNRMKIPMAPAK